MTEQQREVRAEIEGAGATAPRSTLTEFLLARIADVESGKICYGLYAMRCDSQGSPIAPIVPDRVLRRCAADRRIVEDWQSMDARAPDGAPGKWDLASWARLAQQEIVIAELAAVYSDHPDYREGGWNPR